MWCPRQTDNLLFKSSLCVHPRWHTKMPLFQKRPKRAWIHLWKSHHLCCRISLKYVSFSRVTVLISNCSYTLVGNINVHFHVSSYTYVLKNNIVMPGVEGLIDSPWKFTLFNMAYETLHDLTSASLRAVSAPVSNSFVLFTSLVLKMCLVCWLSTCSPLCLTLSPHQVPKLG